MFEILDGRKSFFQWDLNQKLIVYDDSITEVHFCNKSDDCALVCKVYSHEDGVQAVDVPNILLQASRDIRVYGVAADHTEHYARFTVIGRSKPADYVYTETECKTFDSLAQRMDELEAAVSAEGIAQAVADYLEENPVEAGATPEEAEQIRQNAEDINALQEQAAGFAQKSEIPSVEGLATEEYVDQFGAQCLNEVNDMLKPYALKKEIPTVPANVSAFTNDAGYQTAAQVESIVEQAIGNIPTGGGGGGEWTVLHEAELTEAASIIISGFDATLSEYAMSVIVPKVAAQVAVGNGHFLGARGLTYSTKWGSTGYASHYAYHATILSGNRMILHKYEVNANGVGFDNEYIVASQDVKGGCLACNVANGVNLNGTFPIGTKVRLEGR